MADRPVGRSGSTAGGAIAPGEIEEFLTWLVVERGRAANTVTAYRRDLVRYAAWLGEQDLSLGDCRASDIDRHLAGLRSSGRASSSVARAATVIRSLHRFMAAEGLREDDPGALVEAPPVADALPKALPVQDVVTLLDSVDGDDPVSLRDRMLLELLYATGARISEVVGLSVSAIDPGSSLVLLRGKGNRERVVPVGSAARGAVARWLEYGRPALVPARWRSRDAADALLLNQRGGRLTRQGAWMVIDGRATAVGLGDVVSPHVLRHSCATHMLEGGADIRAVQEMLGHASISTTQTYTRVATEHLVDVYRTAHPRATVRVRA